MPITPLNGHLTAGLAGQYSETINPPVDELFTGDTPAVFDTVETVLTGQDLASLTVVGFDSNGKIVPAVEGGGTPIQAVGILMYATDTSATGLNADAEAHIYRGGVFNPDLLVWDASYSTDALKAKAFEGAPSPTQIVIRKIATLAV